MRVIVLLLSPRYQVFSEAMQRKIVDTEGTIKVLLSNIKSISVLLYWTTVQFKILNCRPFSDGFLVYFTSVFLKLIHFHVCVSEEEINLKKHFLSSLFFSCVDIGICPLLEDDRIIPLYTSFYINQWDEWFRKVWEIWLLKLPQLILGCNSKTTVMFLLKKKDSEV